MLHEGGLQKVLEVATAAAVQHFDHGTWIIDLQIVYREQVHLDRGSPTESAQAIVDTTDEWPDSEMRTLVSPHVRRIGASARAAKPAALIGSRQPIQSLATAPIFEKLHA